MARDKEIKGINVFVRVAGELTREYSDNGKENLPANYTDAEDGDKNVAIYYIKSISGTTFRIETKVNRDLFTFENNACDGLLFRFFVDGQLVRNEVYSSDDIAQKDIVVFGPRVPTDQGTAEVKTFQFSEISNNVFVEPEQFDEHKEKTKGLGEIIVKVQRVMVGARTDSNAVSTVHINDPDHEISNKVLAQTSLTHGTSFGKSMLLKNTNNTLSIKHVDSNGNPLVTFVFRYRSADKLKALGFKSGSVVEDADSDDNGSLFLPQDDTDSPSPTATKKSIEKHGVESPAQARTRTASFASFRSVWSRSHAPGPQTPSARGPGSVVSSAPKTKMAAPARANTSLKMTPTKPASQAPKPAAKRLKNAKQLTFLRKLTEDQLLVGFTADELWDNFGKEAVMNESYKKDDIIRAMTDGHIAKATEAFEAARGVAKIGQASTSKNKASSSPKKAMKAPNPPKPKTDFKEFLHKGVVAFDLCTPEPEDDIAEQFANAATTLNLASQPAAASEIVELDAPASNSNGRLGSFPASSIHWDEDSNTRRASEQAIESTSSIEVDMTENVIPSVETTEQNSPAGEVEMVDEAAPVVQHNKEQTIIEINEVSDDDMPTIQDLTKKAEQQKAPINSETSASDIQKPNNSDPTGSGSVFQDTKFVNGDTEMMDFEQGATILSAGSIAGRTRALSVESSTTETTKAAASNDINAHDAFQTGPATSVAAPVGEVQPKSAAGTDIVATENNPRNAAVPALDDAHDDETEDLLADVRRRILEMEETPQQTLTESLEAKSPEVEAHAAADNDEDASLSQSEICSTVSAPAIDVPAIKINDPYSDIESMSPSNQLFNEMPFTAPAPTSGAETPTADSEGEFERLVAAAREDPQGFRSKFDVDSQKLYAKLSQASVSSSGSEKGDEIVENNADAHVGSEDLMDIDSSSQNANEPNDGIINTDDLSQKDVETANAAEVAASIALSETPSTIRTKFINGSVPSGDSSPSKPTPMSQKRDRSAVETETERLLAEETPSKKMKALDLNDAAIPSSLGEKGNDEKK